MEEGGHGEAREVLNGVLWILRTGAQRHYGVEPIAPHKRNRRKPASQDGRALRRYCRRWKIERFFAWLHNFRCSVTRWEYYETNFLGMVQLGCILILLRRYL
jgi:transposase